MICGSADALSHMQVWLQQGPARASVADVRLVDTDLLEFDDFLIVG